MPEPQDTAMNQLARRVRRSGPRGTPEELVEAARAEAAETAEAAAQMPGGLPALGAYRMADLVTPFPAIGRLMGYSPDVGMDPSLVGDALTAGLFGVGAAIPAVRALRGGRQAAEAADAAPPPQAAALAPEGPLAAPASVRSMVDLPPGLFAPEMGGFNFDLPSAQQDYTRRVFEALQLPAEVGQPRFGSYMRPVVTALEEGPAALPMEGARSTQELVEIARRLVGEQGTVPTTSHAFGQMVLNSPSGRRLYDEAINAGRNPDDIEQMFAAADASSLLPYFPTSLRLNPEALRNRPHNVVETMSHELGHAVDALGGVRGNIGQMSEADRARFVSDALVDSRWLQAFPGEFVAAPGSVLRVPQAVSTDMFNLITNQVPATTPPNLPGADPELTQWFQYATRPGELVAQALGNQFTSGREGITQQLLLDALQAPALRGRVQMQ
jgi:hypothetical protein